MFKLIISFDGIQGNSNLGPSSIFPQVFTLCIHGDFSQSLLIVYSLCQKLGSLPHFNLKKHFYYQVHYKYMVIECTNGFVK